MALAALAGLALAMTSRHPPPTVHVEVDVLADTLAVDVVGELQVWNAWLGLDVSGEYLLSDADLARIRSAAAALFATRNPIAVDGARLAMGVIDVIPPTDFIPGRNIPNIRVRLRAGVEREPRTVTLRWETFEQTDWFEKPAVPVMIRYRGDVEQAVLTPHEPEHIWHTRVVQRRPLRLVAVTAAPPTTARLPVLSLLAVALGVALAVGARRRRWPATAWGTGLAATLALAVVVRDVGTVRLPWGGIEVPSGEAAYAIFQRLHGNVYQAFEGRTPEEVYDLLAVSVAPTIIDDLYGDVYESLVLRNQGGAVCHVERIDVFEHAVKPLAAGPDAPRFLVELGWRVHGLVSHWGHEHRRINKYRADYTVEHDGRAWRIAKVQVREQERVDDG